MTVSLYAFTCGTVTGEFAHLMEGIETWPRGEALSSDQARWQSR